MVLLISNDELRLIPLTYKNLVITWLGEWRKHIKEDIPNATANTYNVVFPPSLIPKDIPKIRYIIFSLTDQMIFDY